MVDAKSTRDEENTLILDWIRGKPIPKPELKEFRIFSQVNKQNHQSL